MEWAYSGPGSKCTTTGEPSITFIYKTQCDLTTGMAKESYQVFAQESPGAPTGELFDCRNPVPLS
jgi:hypothetical protein